MPLKLSRRTSCTNGRTISCTKATHRSPTTLVLSPLVHPILLKTRGPHFGTCPVEPRVAGSNPVAHPKTPFSRLHLHLLNRRRLVPSFRIGNNGDQIAKVRPFLLKGTFPEKFATRLQKSCDVR